MMFVRQKWEEKVQADSVQKLMWTDVHVLCIELHCQNMWEKWFLCFQFHFLRADVMIETLLNNFMQYFFLKKKGERENSQL